MKTKLLIYAVVVFALAFVAGCGSQEKVKELLEHGKEARQSEDYEQAIKDYSEAIRLNPKSAKAYAGRGAVFVMTMEFTKAIDDLNKVIDLNPNEDLAHEMLGYAYSGNQQLDAAITNYDIVLKTEPDNGRVFKARGQAYYWKHSFTNAIADLTEALKSRPDDYEIYDDRADSYNLHNEINKALSDYNHAIQLNPEDWLGLFGRGRIYSKLGSYTNAIHDLEKVIKLKPKGYGAYNVLAWLLATCPDSQIRDGKKAVALAVKACDLTKWKKYECVDTLAAAYAETGDFEQAVKYQKQAASIGGVPEDNRTNVLNRVELYLQHKPYRKSNQAYD
ncbi:MAG TPA: tetratricopeptide repeat protein [Verrucomicrobiae bacterium]|nr:tetratricopeptide repeat protein [Verrucomicrobiae bacterium]